tara:strand:+ start:2922 stop:5408 length:2487 start_codon:yes stop_codon:yes gene_type:complete
MAGIDTSTITAKDAGDLVIKEEGGAAVITIKDGFTGPQVEGAVKIKEEAAAPADTAAYGQLWVKNNTPNDLYFVNDAGTEVRITNGSSLAGGGGVASDDITAGDAAVSLTTSSGAITIDSNASTVTLDGHTGVAIISSLSGEVDITSAANIDINATTTATIDAAGVSIDSAGVAANFTVTSDGAGEDLTIALAGATDSSLVLSSTGTAADALQITTSAGGMDITVAGAAAGEDLDILCNQEINITSTSDAANAIYLRANAGTSETIKIHADQGTGADSIEITSDAGSIDINAGDNITIDAADEITITTTSADGHIAIVTAHTAGVAFHLDANANAASEVQLDAGILDIDVTGAATLDAGGAMTLTGAGINLAGGSSEIDITTSGGLDINAAANISGLVTVQTGIVPDAQDGAYLGTTSLQWSDLFMADGAVVGFGDNNEVTLTHVHNLGLTLSTTNIAMSPILTLENTHNGATGGRIYFRNTEAGGVGTPSDQLGSIAFFGNDAAGNDTQYIGVVGTIDVSIDGQESGQYAIKVAAHDGDFNDGFVAVGGSVDAEVDVTIASGAASVTTVAGNLVVTTDLSVDGVANLDNTDIDGTLTMDGTAFDINATTTCALDNANTTNGVTINTATSGSPVSIGNATSETTVNDNLTVTGKVVIETSTAPTVGGGFDGAAASTPIINVSKVNDETITTILVDIGGGLIVSSNTAGDAIGNDGVAEAFLFQLDKDVNGFIYKAELICVEAPTTGDADINVTLHADAKAEDAATESGGHVIINGGAQVLGKFTSDDPSAVSAADGGHSDRVYLTHGGTTVGTYDAGKLVIKLYGYKF